MFPTSFFCAWLAIVPLHSADQSFLEAAVRTESQVVSLSMLTLVKSSAPAMRSLAADLLAHHGAIGSGLDHLLGESAYDVPSTGFVREASHLEKLASLTPSDFNAVVLQEMAVLVDQRAKLFDAAAKRHGNLNVRSLARDLMGSVVQDASRVRGLDRRTQIAQF